jgi:hypothetical protein
VWKGQLVVLPAISDFLQDTFSESLKKPLQPSGLFVAAIFLLLQLLFILPPLARHDDPVVAAILGLSVLWQAALAALLALIMAYLLLSLSTTILKLFTGELWMSSPIIGRGLKALQTLAWRYKAGMVKEQESSPTPENLQARFNFETRFPIDPQYVAPTALGNVLNATAVDIWYRYGMDMAALWPLLETVISEEKSLTTRLENEKATLDFLINLDFILILFSVEYVLLQLVLGEWPNPFLVVGLLVMICVIYRAAVDKAVAWGDIVRMAFELHRGKVATKLELRPFNTRAEERQLWKGVSRWMLWLPVEKERNNPGTDWISDQWFTPVPSSPQLSWVASDNIKVQVRSTHRSEEWQANSLDGQHRQEYVRFQHYVVGLSMLSDAHPALSSPESAYILITDPQVKYIEPVLTLVNAAEWGNKPPTGQIIPADGTTFQQEILWQFPAIRPQSSRVLHFKVPIEQLCVAATEYPCVVVPGKTASQTVYGGTDFKYTFTIQNTSREPLPIVSLMVVDHRFKLPKENILGDTGRAEPVEAQKVQIADAWGLSWPLGFIGPEGTITLEYDVASDTQGGAQ